MSAVEITVRDLVTGDVETKTVADNDWFLLTTGNRCLDGIQSYGNGTVVVTIKHAPRVPA